MGTNMNLPGNFSLMRQPSVYSLTFDEFQTTLGKDFGSMNMEELLKSIWSAEETQNVGSAPAASSAATGVQDGGNQGGYLQRQGSLTIPRTLSLKTVDEVWQDIANEYGSGGKETGNGGSVPQAQRQPTLREITLEEFLMRAGVVREDPQLAGKPNHVGFLGELAQPNANDNIGFGFSFQQSSHVDSNAQISLNVNGVRSVQHQAIAPQMPKQQQQQQPMFPKQVAVSCAPPMAMAIPSSTQLASPRMRNGNVGLVDLSIDGNLAHGSPALQGGGMGIGITTHSPASLSSDGIKSNGDTSSVSPVPYMFNGGLRGRKSNNTVEKVIERRHRRMIKNRESAARSRARKQAYTMELEQEVAKLKEENEALKKKQKEFMEMQKNQALEMMNAQYGAKRRCLRRTLTGPW